MQMRIWSGGLGWTMRVLVLVVVIALDEVVRFRKRSGLGVVIMIGAAGGAGGGGLLFVVVVVVVVVIIVIGGAGVGLSCG